VAGQNSIDDLIGALETVRILQDTVGKHDRLLTAILDRLDEIGRRLDEIEKGARS
jgi:hypothetical protein